jgi:hypothetical protein
MNNTNFYLEFVKDLAKILRDCYSEIRLDLSQSRSSKSRALLLLKSSFLFVVVASISILALVIITILFPFLLIIAFVRNKKGGKENQHDGKENKHNKTDVKPTRFRNPGYDKLIFSLTGHYLGEETEELVTIKKKYAEYDFFAFPLIFNFDLQNKIILSSDLRIVLESKKIGLFVLDTDKYYDEGGESRLDVFPTLSNTNYAFQTEDQEMCGAALSVILDIEIDGIDKLVVWSKSNLSQFTLIPLTRLEEKFNYDQLTNRAEWTNVINCSDVLESLSEYLSLRWKHSTLKENLQLKESAELIKQELFKRFEIDGKPENITLCRLVGPKKPPIWYSRVLPSKSELFVSKQTLYKTVEELHREFPEYDLNTLNRWKAEEYDKCLIAILTMPNLDYKSRIFLKSANLISQIIEDNEADYSAVAIGYAKFFELEINLSLVQLIRRELGIPMPTCYDKHYDAIKDFTVEVREGYNVNFNMKDVAGGNYLPPGLGQSLNTVKKMSAQISAHVSNYDELIREGKKLNTIRNKSAHPQLVFKEDVTRLKGALVKMYINGNIHDLLETKVRLINAESE